MISFLLFDSLLGLLMNLTSASCSGSQSWSSRTRALWGTDFDEQLKGSNLAEWACSAETVLRSLIRTTLTKTKPLSLSERLNNYTLAASLRSLSNQTSELWRGCWENFSVFLHFHVYILHKLVWKTKNIHWAAVLLVFGFQVPVNLLLPVVTTVTAAVETVCNIQSLIHYKSFTVHNTLMRRI